MRKHPAKKHPAKAKKRNPQDATLRNTRATNKRLDALEASNQQLDSYVRELGGRLKELEEKVGTLLAPDGK